MSPGLPAGARGCWPHPHPPPSGVPGVTEPWHGQAVAWSSPRPLADALWNRIKVAALCPVPPSPCWGPLPGCHRVSPTPHQVRQGAQAEDLEGLRGPHGQPGPEGQAVCGQGECLAEQGRDGCWAPVYGRKKPKAGLQFPTVDHLGAPQAWAALRGSEPGLDGIRAAHGPCTVLLGWGEVEQGRGSGAAGWGQADGHPWVPQGPPGFRGQGSAELPLPITVAPCPFPLSLVWELHPKAVLTPSPVRFGCFWQRSGAIRAPCLPRAHVPRGEHHIGGAAAGNPELRGC